MQVEVLWLMLPWAIFDVQEQRKGPNESLSWTTGAVCSWCWHDVWTYSVYVGRSCLYHYGLFTIPKVLFFWRGCARVSAREDLFTWAAAIWSDTCCHGHSVSVTLETLLVPATSFPVPNEHFKLFRMFPGWTSITKHVSVDPHAQIFWLNTLSRFLLTLLRCN